MLNSIFQKIKEWIGKMISPKTIQKKLGFGSISISSEMIEAIKLWDLMYKDRAPWLHSPTPQDKSEVVSLGLPSMIASEKARMAMIEFQSEITVPMTEEEIDNPNYDTENQSFAEPKTIIKQTPVSSVERAEYLNSQYIKLKKALRKQLEYGIAKGSLVIKPYPVSHMSLDNKISYDIEFEYIHADDFYPISFDASGHLIEAVFVQRIIEKETVFTRLEYHSWENNIDTIKNIAFKSENSGIFKGIDLEELGKEVPLSSIPQWSSLQPTTKINGCDRLLFGYFRMPEANTVDTYSPLGVSGFARATDLIKQADKQYSRLLWEFEGGELAIDVDRDALKNEEDGRGGYVTGLPHLQSRLYRKLDLGSEGDTYKVFSPALRDVSYINGLNNLLMRIEDVTGLSRGTLSDVSSEARTATELKILKQRSYQTNVDIQKALQACLDDVIYSMDVYCTLYQITENGEYEVSYEWDDSILTDVEEELSKRIMLMQNGLAGKVENRMWYFGETEQQAREALQKIAEENAEAAKLDNMFDET